MQRTFETEIAGRKWTVETGKYAEQAGGSCLVRCGETAVLVCATVAKAPREGVDFLPLSVDFEEKLYSVGKIPGGFIKREGRPSEKAVLTSRLIDRPLRPLFPKGFYNDVQVIATVLSVEQDVAPDVVAMNGSSIALSISNAPFAGPTGAVSVALVDGEYILNPNCEQREKSRLSLTVAGTRDAVMMVEAGAKEVSEEEMLGAILFAHEEIKKIVAFIEGIQAEVGKPKLEVSIHQPDAELAEQVRAYAFDKVAWSLDTFDRYEREARSQQVKEETLAAFAEAYPDAAKDIDSILYNITKEIVRDKIINRHIRPDGRALDEIRPIWCEVGLFGRTHGSAVFTRGQTQVMTIATLGTMRESQILDGIGLEDSKRYMHQYNMPPYSVGETRPMRSPGRREIGHGNLAERALIPVLPDQAEFPYTIRCVSEVLSSNGSTSQASICGSTLALMDAGVPIKAPVAGISCGLITDGDPLHGGRWMTMLDIQGVEDFHGDMDFKVGGTRRGITAIQMDIKVDGLTYEIVEDALEKCRKGRLYILDQIIKPVIAEPRAELSKYAPKMFSMMIPVDKIKDVIGKGGKVIQEMCANFNCKIDIEEDGHVFISAVDQDDAKRAISTIKTIVEDPEIGAIYKGRVTRLMNFGAFVEIAPGKEGLVHISKLDDHRVERVEDVVAVGDPIFVMVTDIDQQGRINLSRKDALAAIAKKRAEQQ